MPKVSLIIATYNRIGQIPATLESVLAQSRPFDEIILVDDCSPDNTVAWLKQHYPHVRVLQTPSNSGPAVARNLGAKVSSGDILVFFDDDDVMLPGALQNFLDLFAEYPEACAAFTDNEYQHVGQNFHYRNHHFSLEMYRRFWVIATLRQTESTRLFGRGIYKAMLRGNLLQQPFAIARKTFESLGGYAVDVRYCEDWEFYLRLTDRYPVANSDAISSVHIQRGEGANVSLDRRQEPMHRRVLWRRLRAEGFRDPRSALLLARRLAGYYKKAGDLAAPQSYWQAWRLYVKSFLLWPFDPIVFSGAVLFFLPWILAGKTRKVPETEVPLAVPLLRPLAPRSIIPRHAMDESPSTI